MDLLSSYATSKRRTLNYLQAGFNLEALTQNSIKAWFLDAFFAFLGKVNGL
jgi:hypothetical protein